MNFSIPDGLNLPLRGGPDDKLSTTRLSYLKRELRENPLVSPRYIRQGVQEFLPGLRGVIDALPLNSQLLVMPSTTRKNRIPVLLAVEFKKLRPDLNLINLKEKDIKASHRTESKLKGNYVERATDHRHFTISDKLRAAAPQLNKVPTYILDDSISEGDTAVLLHRELSRAGIHARGGILSAVVRERYFVRKSDLSRLYHKMQADRPAAYAETAFQQDLFITFAGFPRKRLTNFERAYTAGDDHHRKVIAFNYVQQVAHYFVAEKLDPAHVLSYRQQQTPDTSLSKKPRPGSKL